MTITHTDAVGVHVPFNEDFPVKYGTEYSTHHVFVRLQTDDGWTGYGEGTALPWFTGDVTAGLEAVASDWLLPEVEGQSLNQAFTEVAEFRRRFPGAYGAMAAVEMALLDLKGKRLGVPLSTLLGAKVRDTIPIVSVLPAHDADTTRQKASRAVADGYEHLKVKANGNVATDVERINAVLSELPADGTLRVDANTAWGTYPTAAKVFEKIADPERIEYVEQPVGVDRVDHMERLWAEFGIPVYADESVSGVADVERYGRAAQIAGCHLKLAKSGSLLELATMATRAREYGMTASVVSAFGTALEATANLQLAAVVDNLSEGVEICTDLLADTESTPKMTQAPELHVPDNPGVGVTLDDDLF